MNYNTGSFTEGNSVNVDPSGCYICADQQPHFLSLRTQTYFLIWYQLVEISKQHQNVVYLLNYFHLEALQVSFPLVGLPISMKTNTGKLVTFTVWTWRKITKLFKMCHGGVRGESNKFVLALWRLKTKTKRWPKELTSSLLDEVLLHVVAVNLGATEDYSLVHFVFFNGSDCVLTLQHLDGFWPHFYNKQV